MYESLPPSDELAISRSDVLMAFKQRKVGISCGPDNVSGIVLKECCEQLCNIFQKMFQWSLNSSLTPTIWKT